MLNRDCSCISAAFVAALIVLLSCVFPAVAGSLRLQPISVEVMGPGQTGTVTLRNEGRTTISVQTRIFKWSQNGGTEDALTPTRNVVVSPPSVKLKPGANYVLRVVRTDKTPIKGEETYRLLVDELPDPSRMRNGAVALTVRQSVPVFFFEPNASAPKVVWSYKSDGKNIIVTAQNNGSRFLRVADLVVKNSKGAVLAKYKGLAGYVLGNSSRKWVFPVKGKTGGDISISASTNAGRIDAKAMAKAH